MPASVATVLRERGHEVLILTEVLPQDSADPIVAKIAQLNGCVLVTQDSDFKQIVGRIPDGAKASVKQLSRISLQCESPKCANRIAAAASLIEFEWEICKKSSDPRMFLMIGKAVMRTSR